MTAAAFRITDPTTPTSAGMYSQLIEDWARINNDPTIKSLLRRWGKHEPALAGYTTPAQLVEAVETSTPARQDELLGALLRLAQRGHDLAGRIVLQQFLPAIYRRVEASLRGTHTLRAWQDERRLTALGIFWETIGTYPITRRPHKVPANLIMEFVHAWCARTRSSAAADVETPVDTLEMHTHDMWQPSQGELAQLVEWAITEHVITADAGDLLLAVYDREEPPAEIAGRLNTTPGNIRVRNHRTTMRLRAAVQAGRYAS